MSDEFAFLGAAEAARRIEAGELTPRDLVEALVERTRRLDPELRTTITLRPEAAADAMAPGPLRGVPFGVKDCISTAGVRTTANSRLLQGWVPASDAPAVRALRAAGAVVLSKLNLNEFAWAIPGEGDLYPPPRNPWRPQGYAMGSSSGAAAAVAAGLVPFALGTDAGGSIRQPAANCGVFGLKPTHGLVPSADAFAPPSICEVGPIARSVEDLALVLACLAGTAAPLAAAKNLKVGVLRRWIDEAEPHPDVLAAFDDALRVFAELGAQLRDVAIANLSDAAAADFVVLNAEAFAAHERTLKAHPELYGPSARLYNSQGAFLTAADYIAARRVGELVAARIDRALDEHDVLVTPVAPLLTAEAARETKARPHTGGVAVFTAPFNLTGHPALAAPAGISSIGVPVGVQLIGRRGGDVALLQAGAAYEAAATAVTSISKSRSSLPRLATWTIV